MLIEFCQSQRVRTRSNHCSGLVVRQGMTLVVIGVALGIAGAMAPTRVMTSPEWRCAL
jgi:hypothetical protein